MPIYNFSIVDLDLASQKTDHSKLLDSQPILSDLMNRVAIKAAHKWQMIGILLHASVNEIEIIAQEESTILMRIAKVFDLWQKRGSSPYTWATIICALKAPLVAEVQLAEEVKKWVIQNQQLLNVAGK